MEGVRRATMRYREAAENADPMTLPPGRKLLREVCGPLIQAITAKQEEARARLDGVSGRHGLWVWPIQMVTAEKLAIITLNAALNAGAPGRTGISQSLASQAKQVAYRVRAEIEYERWGAGQEQANAEAKKVKNTDHVDLLKALKNTYPSVDRRVWARWRTKVKATREEPWDEGVEVALGTCLFRVLVEACPTLFAIAERPASGGVQYYLKTTDECREYLADLTARAEVSSPSLLPMIIPPNPWRYDQAA
jgi:DNA-directed RNA polymerase